MKKSNSKNNSIQIRKYEPTDCPFLANLFYDTVHMVNARDYTEEQLNVWATGNVDLEAWNSSFLTHYTVVAVDGSKIVGFGDMDETGYLDRLYVHKNFQGQGVATLICNELETAFHINKLTTHASITAKSFFAKRGYHVVIEQQVERNGILLTNYIMEKEI